MIEYTHEEAKRLIDAHAAGEPLQVEMSSGYWEDKYSPASLAMLLNDMVNYHVRIQPEPAEIFVGRDRKGALSPGYSFQAVGVVEFRPNCTPVRFVEDMSYVYEAEVGECQDAH